MNKISIPSIENPVFSTELSIRVYDLNYGNHLGNDSLVSLLHEARVQFLMQYGFTEIDVGGVGLLVTQLAVNYKAEAFYGNCVEIKMGIGHVSRTSVDLLYCVTFKGSSRKAATAMTTITFFDYKKSKVAKVPGCFLERMRGLGVAI